MLRIGCICRNSAGWNRKRSPVEAAGYKADLLVTFCLSTIFTWKCARRISCKHDGKVPVASCGNPQKMQTVPWYAASIGRRRAWSVACSKQPAAAGMVRHRCTMKTYENQLWFYNLLPMIVIVCHSYGYSYSYVTSDDYIRLSRSLVTWYLTAWFSGHLWGRCGFSIGEGHVETRWPRKKLLSSGSLPECLGQALACLHSEFGTCYEAHQVSYVPHSHA